MHRVQLADGTIIDAELNGNNFIPEALEKGVFAGNLSNVIITDADGNVEEKLNQKVQFSRIGEIETFILMDKTADEIAKEVLMLALAELDAQREVDKTEANLALAELANILLGGNA